MNSSNLKRFQVLALDGGGFRGLAQAQFLADMEQATGRRTADCFDLITGTSTGAILALAVSLGIPARQIVDFYIEDGRKIFPTNWLSRKIHSIWQWVRPAHSAKPLQSALRNCLRVVGAPEKEPILGDSLTRLVIPAYYLTECKPYYFKTDHTTDYRVDWTRPMWEVAMATTAAPTYFRFFTSSKREHFCDGGLFANNPAVVGIIEAERILKVPTEQLWVLNLGNGELSSTLKSPPWYRNCGFLGWAKSLVTYLLDNNAHEVPATSKLILGERYVRIAPKVSNTDFPLDQYDPDALASAGKNLFRSESKRVDAFFRHTAAPYHKHYHNNSTL